MRNAQGAQNYRHKNEVFGPQKSKIFVGSGLRPLKNRGQSDYPVTLLLFFLVFFLSLIAVGYYFLYDTDRFAQDRCTFTKVFTCKDAQLQPDGLHLELINMYGMDIKDATLTLESTGSLPCQETWKIGDLANTLPTGPKVLCKTNPPYAEGQTLTAKLSATYQDPLLSFNYRTIQGDLRVKLHPTDGSWWDKIFSR